MTAARGARICAYGLALVVYLDAFVVNLCVGRWVSAAAVAVCAPLAITRLRAACRSGRRRS
jgi:hypothetical protein